MSDKILKVIIIGAGGRGSTYSKIMKESGKYQVVGVAEPIESRRNRIKEMFNLRDEQCFKCWTEILAQPKMADIAVIATMDRMHFEPTMKAIDLGYDILLEKPAAPTPEECLIIRDAAEKKGVKILVCHVLRYTTYYSKLKELIENGTIGEVLSVHASENVGNLHQSHSFVRGNWGNSERGTFMILQKTCHDFDIFQWLIGSECKKVHSFGSLTHFTASNAPEGSPDYCIEGCPHGDTCYYNAVKLYLEDEENLWFREASTGKVVPTNEEVAEALKSTQYGKCVYKCDNDVVDHQVVTFEFKNSAVVSFNMCAFNEGERTTRIMGTKGEISYIPHTNDIDVFDFATRKHTTVSTELLDNSILGGHGGGDGGIIDALYDYITNGICNEKLSEIGISVTNHMMSFAAEESRLSGKVIDMDEYIKSLKTKCNID